MPRQPGEIPADPVRRRRTPDRRTRDALDDTSLADVPDVAIDAASHANYANAIRVRRPPQAELDHAEGIEPPHAITDANPYASGLHPFRLTERERGQVVALAAIGCTLREIASVMGVSRDSLIRHAQDLIAQGKAQGRMSLRRAQWRRGVIDGHPQLLIWLGKQILGQRDRHDTTVTGSGGGPVEAEVVVGTAVDTVINRLASIASRRRANVNTQNAIDERRDTLRLTSHNDG